MTARHSRAIALVVPWFAAIGLALAGYVLVVSPLAAEYRRHLDEEARLEARAVVLRASRRACGRRDAPLRARPGGAARVETARGRHGGCVPAAQEVSSCDDWARCSWA